MENLDDWEKVVELDLRAQDLAIEAANNIMLTLIFNPSRPLRRRITELFVRSVDREDLKEFLLMTQERLRGLLAGSARDLEADLEQLRRALRKHHKAIRKKIAEGYTFSSAGAPAAT